MKIATHLTPVDLNSCMLSCTTLRTLLRPRQSAMVHARHLGKKWVLRACGHALFADIAARYEAGVANFVYPGPVEHWRPLLELGLRVAGEGPRLFSASARLKVKALRVVVRSRDDDEELHPGCLFYLGALAESLGFGSVGRVLAMVWHRGSDELHRVFEKGAMDELLKDVLNFEIPEFNFQPMEMFAGGNFFPEDAFLKELFKLELSVRDASGHNFRGEDCKRLLRKQLGNASRDLLSAELRTTLFYVKFLQKIHYPYTLRDLQFRGRPTVTMLCKEFERVLDIRLG